MLIKSFHVCYYSWKRIYWLQHLGETFDGCCSFPCQNQGVCVSENDGTFWCDCTGTGYGGEHCQVRTSPMRSRRRQIAKDKLKSIYSHVLGLLSNESTPNIHSNEETNRFKPIFFRGNRGRFGGWKQKSE